MHSEYMYYLRNQYELSRLYNMKYIAIINHKVVGVYDSLKEAYDKGREQFGDGNFFLKLCQEVEPVQSFHPYKLVDEK